MALKTRHETQALAVPRTRRKHPVRNMTSLPAGKVVPLAVVPMLREDSMKGQFAFAFEMQETVEVLMNGIDVVVEAWVIPMLAFPEFRTMDDLNLAYTKNTRPGELPVPYFETAVAGDPLTEEVNMRLGKHRRAGRKMNLTYRKAYNTLVNFQRAEVSPNIPQRELNDKTLAQALWPKNKFSHIVPDFDQAVMQGEVALNVAEQNLVLKSGAGTDFLTVSNLVGPNNPLQGTSTTNAVGALETVDRAGNHVMFGPLGQLKNISGLEADLRGAVAKLSDNGITISLANIDLARKAQVFANIRKKYNGLSEDMLIDLLMDGITIPEQSWRQPTKIMEGRTRFGMHKRYSGDADALTASVVNGAAAIEFSVNVPRCPPGAVMMIVASIAPEQLFERQEDPFLVAEDADDLPSFISDHLDPEAVVAVRNSYIDEDHDTPDDIYGYAPENHEWNDAGPGIGGRFYRPEVDAGFDEDRNALWAVETQNPTLTKDAYLVPADIHLKPFWTSTIDPFDCVTLGQCIIEGNTQFGPLLIEALPQSDYDAVMDRVDQTRITKQPVAP